MLTMAAIISLIHQKATEHGIDPLMLQAMAQVESGLNPWAIRYEPNYRYILSPLEWASKLRITKESEEMMQKSSLGLLQVMGALARELGHKDHLTQLFDPELNINYSCAYLKRQMKRFDKVDQLIASYNAGTPRWDSFQGDWENGEYVKKVMKEWDRLKAAQTVKTP